MNHLIKQILRKRHSVSAALFRGRKLRFINWYLHHSCNLRCHYCKVIDQKSPIMDSKVRADALRSLREISARGAIVSILGGEPTLSMGLLLEAVAEARKNCFHVNLVTNGYGLSEDTILELKDAGLDYLAVSVDCHKASEKTELERFVSMLQFARSQGIVPVVNTVITSDTSEKEFRSHCNYIISRGIFISPLVCSPEVPGGAFSKSEVRYVPDRSRLRKMVGWLLWKKLSCGMITSNFGYLLALLQKGRKSGQVNLWHCSPEMRVTSGSGRGFVTMDSDGFLGPCQEFPRVAHVGRLSAETLPALASAFDEATRKCPGCLHNCYIMEENLRGIGALAESFTVLRMAKIMAHSAGENVPASA